MELYLAGYDQLARRVHLAFAPRFSDIQGIVFPQRPFVVLLGGDTSGVSVDLIYSTTQRLLDQGAAYILSWGDGARRCEDIVDEATAMRTLDNPEVPLIMTTAHEDESLGEVLSFATTVAIPAEPLAAATADVVLLFHGNVSWFNEARNLLEDMLTGGAA
jgi:hypothetical protein